MSARLMPVIAVALLVLTGAAAVDASLSDAGFKTEIGGEEFDASSSGVVVLNQSEQAGVVYDDQVTVRNQNGTEMVAGQDYRWIADNGTVEVLSGGDLVGSNPATIDYTFRAPSETQTAVGQIFASGFDLVGLLVLLLAVGAVLAAVGRFV